MSDLYARLSDDNFGFRHCEAPIQANLSLNLR